MRKVLFVMLLCIVSLYNGFGQLSSMMEETTLKGFAHFNSNYGFESEKVSFEVGELDLFFTSRVSDKFTILNENVIKLDNGGSFNASIERLIFKYNYRGNHSVLFGKVHTALNYWNDTYHHGRVFFPTIDRPSFFSAKIFPIHTTGIGLQGQNLGDLRFGYDVLVGNGIGAHDNPIDDDKFKSVTIATHMKPIDGLRVGVSAYYDQFQEGVHRPGGAGEVTERINMSLYTASVAYFGNKFEFLSEGTFTANSSDSLGTNNSYSAYAYFGVRVKNKIVPYTKVDFLSFDDNEQYYSPVDYSSILFGVRYDYTYRAVFKLEFQHTFDELAKAGNSIKGQIAVGF